MPEISVIVPVYKVESYLHQCVDSILNQTFRNLEVILVDDGSPDGCPAICDEYAQKDPRVRVIHKENGGLSSARNAGIDAARGEYLSFIDSDDWIDSEMMENLYNAAKKENTEIAVCDVEPFTEDHSVATINNGHFCDKTLTVSEAFEMISRDSGWKYVVAWNKLYKKELFSTIRYPEGYIHEDEFVVHHILVQCSRIASVRGKYYHYRQHSNSIMHESAAIRKTDILSAFADRLVLVEKMHSALLQRMADRYVDRLFTDYYAFPHTEENRLYHRRMWKSLKIAWPVLMRCPEMNAKRRACLTIMRVNPELYRFVRKLKK